MRTVSEKYANSSNHYMTNTDLFSTETITAPIGFRLFAIAQLSLSEKYSAKWDQGFSVTAQSFRCVLPEKHERILRSIIRRFGGFPTRTYSNRISNDVNVRITYEECSGRVLNLNKTCA